MWKSLSRSGSIILAFLVLTGPMLAGCAPRLVGVERSPGSTQKPEAPASSSRPAPETAEIRPRAEEGEKSVAPDPRALAALRLIDQAQQRLEARQPDQAIRILERALSLDPTNGRNFYFLAEAWLMKGVIGQAREFNRLAGVYLSGEDPSWEEKVKRQKERIEEMR